MPALTYSVADFLPFTKILSADVNSRFSDIKTLLNTTKLDSTNVQQYGLTRDRLAAGTASHVVINDASGYVSSEAQLSTTRGGLGFAPTISSGNAGKVVGVNDSGAALELRTPQASLLVEQLANDVATIVAGEVISVREAVCLDINESAYKVFKTDLTKTNRVTSFLGFARAAATVTAQVTDITKTNTWSSGTVTVTVNSRTYPYTYSTSNDNSMTSLATAISADPDVASAAVQGGSPYNTIRITGRGGLTLTISVDSTGPTWNSPSTVTSPVGDAVSIHHYGPLSGFSSLTFGGLYYLDSSTPGAITTTPGTTQIFVGQAISSTVLFVNPYRFNNIFGQTSLLLRLLGSTTNAATGGTTDGEQYNLSAWAAATAAGVSRSYGSNGTSTYNGKAHFVDGYNTSTTLTLTNVAYNRISWSTLANRTNVRGSFPAMNFNNLLYCNFGQDGGGGGNTDCLKYATDSWTTGTAWTASGGYSGNFTYSSALHGCRGRNAGAAQNDHYEKNTSDSNTTDTAVPASVQMSNSGQGPSNGLIMWAAAAGTTTAGYAWAGSWSSVTMSFTAHTDYCNGSSLFNGSNYTNGGSSNGTAIINTTQVYNGTTFSSGTASTNSRAGGVMGSA